ncbi:MAG: hypothetical protein U5Q44_02355 [Dehalococcoidia bacterium]|nr:hypothetical protein [Dehalococcoidia bacterium]
MDRDYGGLLFLRKLPAITDVIFFGGSPANGSFPGRQVLAALEAGSNPTDTSP